MISRTDHPNYVRPELTGYRLHEFRAIVEGSRELVRMRAELQRAGYDGWTEYPCNGYWRGGEPSVNTEVSIFTDGDSPHRERIARALLAAHRDQPSGVFQLVAIAPDGARELVEVRAA